ncbi:MAG: DEAD/DEAH box helicase family protein [Planctomycetota bacterium]
MHAARGVAVREFPLATGHGAVDYLLFVDARAVGVLEAKPEGHTLSGVEVQADRYARGLPRELKAPVRPLPFLYLSTGAITRFTNLLDPDARSREVFAVHRPETLADWLRAETLDAWVRSTGAFTAADDTRPSSLRARLRALPPLSRGGLWPAQHEAITNLEHSLQQNHPRALVQMATGSGKTMTAVAQTYRLLKFGGACRVLFLVDRGNLGIQAEGEFRSFRSPDDRRKLDELYNVNRLTSNTVPSASSIVITTIQRLYSMLRGEPEDVVVDEHGTDHAPARPVDVEYNALVPPEFFDVIFVDECHRSIYSTWRQVLEYFDCFTIGLTATPAAHTYGFFHGNLVMEYGHERAVADGVNVDFDVYRIRTKITEQGATILPDPEPVLGKRDRRTRKTRWEVPDVPRTYDAGDLDRDVVARDQIRTVIRAFRKRCLPECFPNRTYVPKTLIFAKDDSHAEDIVDVVRAEFGKGNEFCQKITYKTTGVDPKELIRDFRTSVNPRIAVTVDMIATGTDIKPIEIVMFLRTVKSRLLFEQMKGRGVRTISATDLRQATPDATVKDHFVVVDCVGATEQEFVDTQPIDRKKSVSFEKLLEHVAAGGTDDDMLSSLASRLARLHQRCSADDELRVRDASGGTGIAQLAARVLDALDDDTQAKAARERFGLAPDVEPSEKQVETVAETLLSDAVRPLATKPELRTLLVELKKKYEQTIDDVNRDELLEAGTSAQSKDAARALVSSFEQYLEAHKDEFAALEVFYAVPHRRRLRYEDFKKLAAAITTPPRAWTRERLWAAYQLLERDKVRGASGKRLFGDIVSLVRFALHEDGELVPHADVVHARFDAWLAEQRRAGRAFTPEQLAWLGMIRDHVATSIEIVPDDFDLAPFAEQGGRARASQVFGSSLNALLDELNGVLAA